MLSTGLSAAKLLKLPGGASPVWAIFDPPWYARVYSDACGALGDTSPTALLDFYLQVGQGQGHSPNKYFDETWYRTEYPEIVRGIEDSRYLSGFDQYCRQGHRTLAPHWLFKSEQYYREQNPDLTDDILDAANVANGYDHFLRRGAQACRRAHPFFDPAIYQAGLDPDAAGVSVLVGPFLHFLDQIDTGQYEGRTSQYFDPHWYLEQYPEVGSAIGRGAWRCALHHYLANDTPTRFDPTPEFSEVKYLRSYPDIAAAVYRGRFRNGYAHFIQIGLAEGRSSGAASEPLLGLSGTGATNELVESDEYQGTLDLCSSTRLEGWAVKNSVPAELEVAVNDQVIRRINCGWRRPDLVQHGLPIDAGFEVVFDTPIAPDDRVSVRFLGGPELTNSPSKPIPVGTSGTKLWTKGNEFLGYLVDLCELQPNDAVLDVGCGSGRTALPLTRYLNREGRYAGFDIARKAIAWCTENVSGSHPNFDFTVADVQRKMYNPTGRYKPSEFSFPYPDGSFDVIVVTSDFTRMLPAGVKHYMDEIVRVLKPGGRSLITFFLLNEESLTLSEEGKGTITFEHEVQGARTADVNDPEAAIAYPEAFVRDLYDQCGLEIREPLHYGSWCGRLDGISGQDVVVAVKPAS